MYTPCVHIHLHPPRCCYSYRSPPSNSRKCEYEVIVHGDAALAVHADASMITAGRMRVCGGSEGKLSRVGGDGGRGEKGEKRGAAAAHGPPSFRVEGIRVRGVVG